jgi:hypothetical protein
VGIRACHLVSSEANARATSEGQIELPVTMALRFASKVKIIASICAGSIGLLIKIH